MSPGIFISYSRDDEKHALHLLNLLRREGYSVWIDQEAIAGASIWSDEIVQNIKRSQIFIALLSQASTGSANVAKEIALAAEHGKVILPIEVEHVTLPGQLEYALAGIQRTQLREEEAILRAVRSQVARLEGTESDKRLQEIIKTPFERFRPKAIVGFAGLVVFIAGYFLFFHRAPDPAPVGDTVAVLPFETLNLDRDSTSNLDVFSDALLTRLAALNGVKTIAASVSSAYKNSQFNALTIAKNLNARFIVEGLVRKAHDVNFVSARLIDTKEGGEIWEQFYSGNNTELFSIRERVTTDIAGYVNAVIADELRIHNAEQNLAAHPNDAAAYATLATILLTSDKARALALFEHAIKLDSNNIAYYLSAGIAADRAGMNATDFGKAAIVLCRKELASHPDSVSLAGTYAIALDLAGQNLQAQNLYDSLLKIYPKDVRINYNAACCFARQGKADTSVAILKRLFVFAPGKKGEVRSDPDFDNIRSFPQYQKLMLGAEE